MKKAVNYDKPTPPVPKVGWAPSFEVPDAAEGWTTKPIMDDRTLLFRAVRGTRDDSDHRRWKTYYLQVVSEREVKRMRRKLQRMIEKDKTEQRKRFGRVLVFL